MSSSEEEVEVVVLPKHRIRYTDMPRNLIERAILSKFLSFLPSVVCAKANDHCKLDKDVSTYVQDAFKMDDLLKDDRAGWHILCGKSFASAITYQTHYVLFFDLLENTNKSFLMFKTQ